MLRCHMQKFTMSSHMSKEIQNEDVNWFDEKNCVKIQAEKLLISPKSLWNKS